MKSKVQSFKLENSQFDVAYDFDIQGIIARSKITGKWDGKAFSGRYQTTVVDPPTRRRRHVERHALQVVRSINRECESHSCCRCSPASLPGLAADNLPPAADRQLAREIYREMIEIKSGFTTGATTPIAEAVAARLKAAGFPDSDIFLGGAVPRKFNLVVRYHGTGRRKPILLLAHIDVVEALRADWTTDPFVLLEKDGYFYGRGTMDDKAQAAVWIANLIRYKREGFRPDRDLIVALTADEEGGGPFNGVDWLLKNHRNLIEAEFAINEGARGEMVDGKRVSNDWAQRKGLCRLPARGPQQRRPQRAPGPRQRHLPSGRRTLPPLHVRLPVPPE